MTVLPSNLMETELTGPKINVYIKPNMMLGPTCTMDPGTLMAMVHDAAQEAARDVFSVPMSVPELQLRAATASLKGLPLPGPRGPVAEWKVEVVHVVFFWASFERKSYLGDRFLRSVGALPDRPP